jgi:hypothetical protein
LEGDKADVYERSFMAEMDILSLKYFGNCASCPFAFSVFHCRLEAHRRGFSPVAPSINAFKKNITIKEKERWRT